MDRSGGAEKSAERSGGEESMMFFVGVVVGIGVGILSVIVTLLAVADREERKTVIMMVRTERVVWSARQDGYRRSGTNETD